MNAPPHLFAFIRGQRPRMYAYNLVTREWLNRDVQGWTQPMVTRVVMPAGGSADSFTCTFPIPRDDLVDHSGNMRFKPWQTGIFLEEDDSIKFGGIYTQGTRQGPSWQMTCTGFAGYPNGIPWETSQYTRIDYPMVQVFKDIWSYIQSQRNSNLRVDVIFLGPDPFSVPNPQPLVGASTQLVQVTVIDPTTHKKTTALRQKPVPFVIDWWNSTDLGQELNSLAAEGPLEWVEKHEWQDVATKKELNHHIVLNTPRIGNYLSHLRFVEGENLAAPPQVVDGQNYANAVIAVGAGQGRLTKRAHWDMLDGRLRRPQVYNNQTTRRLERLSSEARREVTALSANAVAITQIIVKQHINAPLGSFAPGDDIYVTCTTGWNAGLRQRVRILQTQQDPTTQVITLTTAPSHSFSYMSESGTAGTM